MMRHYFRHCRRPAAVAVLIMVSMIAPIHANEIPSSNRSQAAVERSTIDLNFALKKARLELGSAVFIRIFKKEAKLEVWLRATNPLNYFGPTISANIPAIWGRN